MDGIDASLGLDIALNLLQQHQSTGEMSCTLTRVHMFKTTREKVVIHIHHGQVVSCSMIDETGNKRPTDIVSLIQLDRKRGPLNWSFHSHSVVPSSAIVPAQSSPSSSLTVQDDAIPARLLPELSLSWLQSLPEGQIAMLKTLWPFINGVRSVADIKVILRLRFSSEVVERMLMFLIAMHHITMRRK